MSTNRVNIPYARKGDPDVRTVVLPAGFISLEDLLEHVGFQCDVGSALKEHLEDLLAAEFRAGRRALSEELQNASFTANPPPVDMEAAHRILTAETLGYPA